MSWRERLPPVRGRLLFDEPLAPFTWLRVGGPADLLFLPADAQDLGDLLQAVPEAVPTTVLGVGSNVIVRDGGVEGLVIRLAGRAFAEIHVDRETCRVTAGGGALDANVARAAADAGVAGLEFLAGIPGTIGGALTMNAGCYGREIQDILVTASAIDARGRMRGFELKDFGYSYRASRAPSGMIWRKATFQGRADAPAAIKARMAEITARREASQPIREKTGGSTFKNPPGDSAWRLIDAAGWRGKPAAARCSLPARQLPHKFRFCVRGGSGRSRRGGARRRGGQVRGHARMGDQTYRPDLTARREPENASSGAELCYGLHDRWRPHRRPSETRERSRP